MDVITVDIEKKNRVDVDVKNRVDVDVKNRVNADAKNHVNVDVKNQNLLWNVEQSAELCQNLEWKQEVIIRSQHQVLVDATISDSN